MADNVPVDALTNLEGSSAVQKINQNFEKLSTALDQVLWKDGRESVTGDIDLNGKNLLNSTLTIVDDAQLDIIIQSAITALPESIEEIILADKVEKASVNISDFGADVTGVFSADFAIQAAINALPSVGGVVNFPVGLIKIASGSFSYGTKNIEWRGAGKFLTRINFTHPSNDLFRIGIGDGTAAIRDMFIFSASGLRTAGSYVVVEAGPGHDTNNWCAENVIMIGYYVGISALRTSAWNIDKCYFGNTVNSHAGLIIDNLEHGDSGDSCITASLFCSNGSFGGTGIIQKGSGGLKIVATKFNVLTDGFVLDLNNINSPGGPLVGTTILIISACSFENFTHSGIWLKRAAGATSNFTSTQIIGNQFSTYQDPGAKLILVEDNGNVFQYGQIKNNMFIVNGGGYGIDLQGSLSFDLDGNKFFATPGLGGGTCIRLGVNSDRPFIGQANTLQATGGLLTYMVNNSLSAILLDKTVVQKGYSVACNTLNGNLYYGIISVTWPAGLFSALPSVTAIPIDGGIASGVQGGTVTLTGANILFYSPVSATLQFDLQLIGH